MKLFTSLFVLALLLVAPHALASEGFQPLTQIPVFNAIADASTLPAFLNNLYKLCIGAAAVLAALQIMRGGLSYMMGDSITEKKEARSLIVMSVVGLILVLSPAIVFGIIDPRILDLDINFTPLTPRANQIDLTLEERCAVVTPGRIISPDLRECCSYRGWHVHDRRSDNITCETTPQATVTAGDHGGSNGDYFYNVPTTVGTYGTLRAHTEEGAACTTIQYGSFESQSACAAATPGDSTGATTNGWYTYYSCFQELHPFRRVTGMERAFCSDIQPLGGAPSAEAAGEAPQPESEEPVGS